MIIETLKVRKNVTTVDRTTVKAKEIVLHLARHVINVVGKTTSGLCAHPKSLGQSMTQGQMGPEKLK